jgi:hypothetical protein
MIGLKPLLLRVLEFAAMLEEWDRMVHAVKGVLWPEKAVASRGELIRDDVMQIISIEFGGGLLTNKSTSF